MPSSTASLIKNLHLIVSVAIVAPTGLLYGSPSLLPDYLDIQVHTIDLANMLKANMALYLSVSAVWVWGMIKPARWQRATELNVLFMLALGGGRLLSMATDGLPTGGYLFGVLAELALGGYAAYQLLLHSRPRPTAPRAADA